MIRRLMVVALPWLLLGVVTGCFSTSFGVITDPFPPPPHPPMGWNTFYAFGYNISDALIRQQADAMVANGMRDAGYMYVNIDDGWQGERDAEGNLQGNASFPDMQALAAYIHSKGLKFGLYSSIGPKTCGGLVGSYGHEEQDAKTFLAWDIDFLKYDLCALNPTPMHVEDLVGRMSRALRKNEKHSIVLSIVVLKSPWRWAPLLATNMWRITTDFLGDYPDMLGIVDIDAPLAGYADKEHWNDPDMLWVGHSGMTTDEYRTHMTMWVMLSAPLISSVDLRNLDPTSLSILTNRDAIAINQDAAAQQATRVQQGPVDVWVKNLSTGTAIAIVNRSATSKTYSVDPSVLHISTSQAHEVWTNQTVKLPSTVALPPHSCVLLRTL